MNPNPDIDDVFVERLRARVARETPPPPTYDEFLAQTRGQPTPTPTVIKADPAHRGAFALVAVLTVLAAIGIGRYLIPAATTDPASEIIAAPKRVHTLDTPPTGETGPPCWISFQDGNLNGGCQDGSLQVVEYGDANGYVDGWNNFTSLIQVPAGWDVYTYHQMWELGAAENARRQGFIHHQGGTTTDLSDGPQPLYRDPDNLNWDYCRTWNPEIIDNTEPQPEQLVNNNTQCIHIKPQNDEPDRAIIIAATNPPISARLEIFYQQPRDR